MIVINYTFAFFFVLQMSSPVSFHRSGRTDRRTGVFAWIERRWTENVFDVQFAVILLLSDSSSQTGVHNAPVNCYKPAGSRALAAVRGRVFIQVFSHFSGIIWHQNASFHTALLFPHDCDKKESKRVFLEVSTAVVKLLQFISKPTEREEVVTHDTATYTHEFTCSISYLHHKCVCALVFMHLNVVLHLRAACRNVARTDGDLTPWFGGGWKDWKREMTAASE